MKKIEKSVLVPYTAAQCFAVAADVENYPAFVPFCSIGQILSQEEEQVTASLTFQKAGLSQTFSTCNTMVPHTRIVMQLVDGPFKHLSGEWAFSARGDYCQVSLLLEFEFSAKLVAMVFEPIFRQAMSELVDQFQARAKAVYGVAA